MKKEVLFVLLDGFADWEGAYIAPALHGGVEPGSASRYVVKTVTVDREPVVSCGGFKVMPDYGIEDVPAGYAGVVLVGGMGWLTPQAEAVVPLIKEAVANHKPVGGICNASVFLAKHGFLNGVSHTGNGLDYLKNYAGTGYRGEARYKEAPAVRDANIITANGFSALEFSREILYALEADIPGRIERSYRMSKTGVWEAPGAE